uniref:Uncharacterized protein n=1 Tax=Magallana gigas TaxID=29159 RepID=A0A8W8NKP4_MAGGI
MLPNATSIRSVASRKFGTESSVGQSYDVGTIRQLACSSGPLGGLRIKGDRSRWAFDLSPVRLDPASFCAAKNRTCRIPENVVAGVVEKMKSCTDTQQKILEAAREVRCSSQNGSRSAYPVCHVDNNTMIPSPQVLEHHQISWEFWQYMLPLFGYIVVFRCLGYTWLRFVQKPH